MVHDRPDIFSEGRVGEHEGRLIVAAGRGACLRWSYHRSFRSPRSAVASSFDAPAAEYAMQNRQKGMLMTDLPGLMA